MYNMKEIFIKNPKIIFSLLFSMIVAAGGVGMFYYMNSSSKEAVYYNLSEEDAAKIVEKLKENKIAYSLENGGRTVMVDADKVAEVRLMLASNGLPSDGSSGFELFDKNRLGLSGFSERVNYRRALEGELSRSISSIEGVKYARVHIAMPEPNIFVGKQEAASASVVVHTYKNFTLSSSQIKGIVNLVSGAVEGLKPENVSITDGDGKLVKPVGDDYDVAFLNEAETEVEKKLTSKIAEVLNKVYGQGKTVVSVDVDLNLDKLESVKETYNPNPVLTSAISSSEESNQGESKSKKNSSEMKYQTDKIVEKFIKRTGEIKKMSVSVAVSSEVALSEVSKIRELVSTASGFDAKRGDSISINFFDFPKVEKDTSSDAEFIAWKKEMEKKQMIREAIKYSSFVFSAIIILIGLYLFSGKMFSKGEELKAVNALKPNTDTVKEQMTQTLQSSSQANNQTQKLPSQVQQNIKQELTDVISKNSKDISKFLESYIESGAKKETANV